MQGENYVDKSLTKLNELLDTGKLHYKPPVTKREAIEVIRNYVREFPLKYVAKLRYYVHGDTGISSLCDAFQISYSDVMLDSRSVPYSIDKGAELGDVQEEVREIVLKECDSVMDANDSRAAYPHICILYAVIDAYTKYRNASLPESNAGRGNEFAPVFSRQAFGGMKMIGSGTPTLFFERGIKH